MRTTDSLPAPPPSPVARPRDRRGGAARRRGPRLRVRGVRRHGDRVRRRRPPLPHALRLLVRRLGMLAELLGPVLGRVRGRRRARARAAAGLGIRRRGASPDPAAPGSPAVLCRPCSSNDDCSGGGLSSCAAAEGARDASTAGVCGVPCAGAAECPVGFRCGRSATPGSASRSERLPVAARHPRRRRRASRRRRRRVRDGARRHGSSRRTRRELVPARAGGRERAPFDAAHAPGFAVQLPTSVWP